MKYKKLFDSKSIYFRTFYILQRVNTIIPQTFNLISKIKEYDTDKSTLSEAADYLVKTYGEQLVEGEYCIEKCLEALYKKKSKEIKKWENISLKWCSSIGSNITDRLLLIDLIITNYISSPNINNNNNEIDKKLISEIQTELKNEKEKCHFDEISTYSDEKFDYLFYVAHYKYQRRLKYLNEFMYPKNLDILNNKTNELELLIEMLLLCRHNFVLFEQNVSEFYKENCTILRESKEFFLSKAEKLNRRKS